ncbi:hypothetical protein LCGC14_1687010 [marine sediment metagenome]|uniref:Uncharacterized protein n=1 Tax=marine sediment metagenome TaxID=412755 RepID=A0A0F9HM08_9ZZZZ
MTYTAIQKEQQARDISSAHICYGKHRLVTTIDGKGHFFPCRDGVKCDTCSYDFYCNVFRQLDNQWMNGE